MAKITASAVFLCVKIQRAAKDIRKQKMICYNISLNKGGMSNEVFLLAFHELIIMGPIPFILVFFLYSGLSKKIAFLLVTPGVDKPIMIILAISFGKNKKIF